MKKTLISVGSTLGSKLTSFKNLSVLVVVLLLMSGGVKGQSTANYAFTTNTTGSLALDANGNAIDMTSGTTQLVAASSDATVSSVTNIGFNYYFMGNVYSQFTTSADGILGLGSIAVSGNALSGGSTTTPRISALSGDLYVSSSGKVHFKLIGSAPNRCLVIEWTGMAVTYNTTAANGNSTWQVRLYETTGVVENVYGAINCTSTTYNPASAGFSVNTTENNRASITFSNNSVSNGATFNTNTLALGDVPNLNSTTNGSRRVYKFTPPTPAAGPSNLTFASVTASTTTLNWTAASPTTNIVRYVVFNSTNGGTSYNFVANVALGTNTYAATGLTPGNSYTWKVVAISEGVESTPTLIGTQSTTAGATYYWVGLTGGAWATAANWNTLANGTGTTRTVVATTDVLIVDGAGTTAGGAMSISVDLASFSIGQLKVTSNTALTLASSATTTRTITITGGGEDDFVIENGSSLILNSASNAVAFAFSGTGHTGDISGILTFAGSTSNLITTTGGTRTLITVSPTGIVNNSIAASSGCLAGSAATLSFANGSNYNHSGFTTSNGFIPTATWEASSTATLSGGTSSTGLTSSSTSLGNLTYNSTTSTGGFNCTLSSVTIQGNLTISNTNTGTFRLVSSGTATINGNVLVSAGTFLPASSTGTVNCLGTTTVATGANFSLASSSSATYIQRGTLFECNGTIVGSGLTTGGNLYFYSVSNTPQTLSGTNTVGAALTGFTLENTGGLTISLSNSIPVLRVNCFGGTISNSNKIIMGTGAALACAVQVGYSGSTIPGGSFDVAPTFNLGTGLYSVIYAQESVSRTTGFEIPSTRTLNSLSLSNSNGLTIAGGALSSGALTFSAGCGNITTSSSNVLTISGTTTGAITRTSTTAYVNGPLALTLPASLLTGSTYVFPIGKGTLNSLELINPTTNAGGTVTIQAEVFDANSGGTAGLNMGSLNTDRYWAASITSGSGNFTNTFIRLNDASVISTSAISSSATQTGSYDLVGGTLPTIVAGTSITSATTASTSIPGFYNIGTKAVPMAYTSSTTTQAVTTPILTNTTNQQIIGVQVVTTGNASPLSITSMTFNTTGTTSTADITNAKIFYTGTSSTFATTTQFGSTNATPNGSYNITGSQALAEGTNYFWLTYDIPNGATVNNVVDAECTSLTVGSAQTPTASAPTGTRTIKAQLNGTYSIGASQTSPNYSSLTSAISDLNSYGVSGAVIFQLMSDYSSNYNYVSAAGATSSATIVTVGSTTNLAPGMVVTVTSGTGAFAASTTVVSITNATTFVVSATPTTALSGGASVVTGSETYPYTINAITGASGTNTITIKPAATVTATISGSSSTSIIRLNGADYVAIDGSNNGSASRNLTITNTNSSTSSAVVWLQTATSDGATNNTIKNCNIVGNSNTQTFVGIGSGSSTISTASLGTGNNSNSFINNNISKTKYGIFTQGASANNKNTGTIINNNLINTTTPNNVQIGGIYVGFDNGATISGNSIAGMTSITDAFGISTGVTSWVATTTTGNEVSNAVISKNVIGLVQNTGSNSAVGILLGPSTTGTNQVSNNMVYGVIANSTPSDLTAGIFTICGVGATQVYYNTVSMTGDRGTSTTASSIALAVMGTDPTIDITNNILINKQTTSSTGKSYAIGLGYTTFVNLTSNNNDLFTSGANGNFGVTGTLNAGADRTSLALWQTATGGNANSLNLDPTFISATDLHLTSANTALKAGTYISSVLTDYDGDTRNVLTPTMGADEIYISNLWTGTSSTAFATTGNWDDNAVPSSGANITIPTGVTNKPVLASDITIGTLALGSGTTLTIGSNTLTINGAVSGTGTLTGSSTSNLTIAGAATTLNFTSGSRSLNNLSLGANGAATLGTALDIYGTIGFTTGGSLNMNAQAVALKSTASATASISDLTSSTLSGATNLTVERYIPANRKYRFLAAPVVGATAAQWRDNGGTTPGIGTHITGGSVGSNFDQSTLNAPSAFWYNEANAGSITDVGSGASSDPGWTAFTDGNTQALTNGKGFRVFVRGDRTLSLTGSIPTANNTTLSVTGTYPANSVTIATTKSASNTNSGFNLVGNPYPSTIDWNAITKGTGITNTYSTFNPSANAYVQWNGTTGDATRYIASGQAFFVYQESGTTSSITIAEANKVSNAAGNFFRNKLTDHLKVSMKYDSANYDAAFIHFREDALNEFDNYDGLKFQNAGVNIASVGTDGKRYNINSLASLTKTTEMPLSVLGSALTNFELKFEDVESFKNHELYLIDHYLNKMILLSDGFTYPIELSSDSASVKDGRFKIVFVQKVTGIQNNNKNAHAFILYPNPAANSIHILLDAKNTNSENVSFEIFNQLGARLQQGNLDFTTAKDQTIAIDNLAQGSYFIKLQSKSIHQTIKFIK